MGAVDGHPGGVGAAGADGRYVHHDTKTVRPAIKRHEAGAAASERKPREHNSEHVRELVADKVAKTQGRISAMRLLPGARAEGHEGSARNFRRLVAAAMADWRREHHRRRRPAVWSPGEHLLIDWGVLAGAARVLRGAGLVADQVRALRR